MTQEQQALIDEVVNELRPLVEMIEKKLATTKDHYGDYMNILGRYPKEQRPTIAVLLIKARANPEGVKWALKLC